MSTPPSTPYTLLSPDELSKRIPYDVRTIRERLTSADGPLRRDRHYTSRPGSNRIFFIWEAICADLGLPHPNFGPGDLLCTEDAAKVVMIDERTLREAWTRSNTVIHGVHYFVFPGSRKLIFSREAMASLIPTNPGTIDFRAPPVALPLPQAPSAPPGFGDALLESVAVHKFAVVAERWAEGASVNLTARSRTIFFDLLRVDVLPIFSNARIVDVTRQQIIDCLFEVSQKKGRESAKAVYKLLGDIFAFSNRVYGWPSPMATLHELPHFFKLPKVFSGPQCFRLAELCPEAFKPYLVLRLATGLRNEEVHSLRWSAVSLTAATITLEEIFVHGEWVHLDEFRGRRVIPLCNVAVQALQRLRALSKRDDSGLGFVFHDDRGDPLSAHWMTTKFWDPLLRVAGFPSMQLRELRNTAPYLWLSAGESPADVAQWYGYGTDVRKLLSRFESVARIDPQVTALDRFWAACIGPAESVQHRMLGVD